MYYSDSKVEEVRVNERDVPKVYQNELSLDFIQVPVGSLFMLQTQDEYFHFYGNAASDFLFCGNATSVVKQLLWRRIQTSVLQ